LIVGRGDGAEPRLEGRCRRGIGGQLRLQVRDVLRENADRDLAGVGQLLQVARKERELFSRFRIVQVIDDAVQFLNHILFVNERRVDHGRGHAGQCPAFETVHVEVEVETLHGVSSF
jgi:hypothetical protein